ncbi:hypothetical protein MBLNU457_1717t1 [Dothideomycetes sp. NU457]
MPSQGTSSLVALRGISYRLSLATPAQLPRVAAHLADTLRTCHEVLSQPPSSKQDAGEGSVIVHRLATQIATLLQARTAEERLAAVILIKSMIEAGGWEVLSRSKHWVTGLINNLRKPDPSSSKMLSIITITRIFMLTWDYPTLIREITTPSLTGFVSTCITSLQSDQCGLDEQQCILESFAQLVPRHPTVFRTQAADLRRIVEGYFTNMDIDANIHYRTYPAPLKGIASRLLALLHQCEPKQGSTASWERSLEGTVKVAQVLLDHVFVGIEEDWVPTAEIANDKQSIQQVAMRMDSAQRTLSVYRSAEAFLDVLDRLTAFSSAPTSASVSIALGPFIDLAIRAFATTVSLGTDNGSARFHQDVSKEERDAIAAVLPRLHVRVMLVLISIVDRYEDAIHPIVQPLLDQLSWVFSSESGDMALRTATYTLVRELLIFNASCLTKDAIEYLGPIIRTCCDDLLRRSTGEKIDARSIGSTIKGGKNGQPQMNADAYLMQPGKAMDQVYVFEGLHEAAYQLLPILLSRLPADLVPDARRVQMDRTAILIRHKDALVASVLNGAMKQGSGQINSSILPFLAREYPGDERVEALLRPRMPRVQQRGPAAENHTENTYDEDEGRPEDRPGHYDGYIQRAELPASENMQERVDDILEPSHTPPEAQEQDVEARAIAHDEQNLIHDALSKYQEDHEIQHPVLVPARIETTQTSGTKRPHDAAVSEEVDAKRQRASEVAGAMAGVEQQDLPGQTATDDLPQTMILDDKEESVVTVPAQAQQHSGPVARTVEAGKGVDLDSDDEEFVVPTLDLRESSDEEDEDE